MTKKKQKNDRRIITPTITVISPNDFDGKVSEIIKRLQEWQAKHGEDIFRYLDILLDWDPNHWYPYEDSPTPIYYLQECRLETDEEFAKRVAEDEAQQAKWDADARRQYEALKKKFESQ